MVRLSAIFACITLAGCSWWGEAPPKSQVIEFNTTSSSCPSPEVILEKESLNSTQSFDCWANETRKLWTDIKGQRQDYLSDDEIRLVVKKGMIKLPGDQEKSLNVLFEVRNLFGMSEGLSRVELEEWLSWIRSNLPRIRTAYRKYVLLQSPFVYAEFEDSTQLVADFLSRIGWDWSDERLGSWIATVLDRPHSGHAIARAGLDLLGSVCPLPHAPERFVPQEAANCFRAFSSHFRAGAPWFEMVLNPILEMPSITKITYALDQLHRLVPSWFGQNALKPIHTQVWIDLGKSLGYDPPDDIHDSLNLIKKFDPGSSAELIRPVLITQTFQTLYTAQKMFLEGIPFYHLTFLQKLCVNPDPSGWSTCVLPAKESGWPPIVELALRLRNPNFGNMISPIDGRQFGKFTLFHAFSAAAIKAFDKNNDGLISTGGGDPLSDEVVQLVRALVQSIQSIDRWLAGIQNGLKGNPPGPTLKDFPDGLDPKGFARLITLVGSDILARRTPSELDFFTHLVSLVSNSFPSGSIHLDQLGLTALLIHADMLPEFRKAYISSGHFRVEPSSIAGHQMIHRAELVASLDKLLKAHYPRTLSSCTGFGYHCSCAIALDELIRDPSPGEAMIPAENLDILSIILWGFEGALDSCDRNADSRLSLKFLSGNDELDCGYTKIKDIVIRLMDAKVIPNNPGSRLLLEFLNGTFITRTLGKVTLAKGDKRDLLLNPFLQFKYQHATIGSMYSLISDILNSDRLTTARNNGCR